MNENEIKRQLKACDDEIAREYNMFNSAVSAVGNAASNAASSYRMMTTLIAVAAGVILCMVFYSSYHEFLGLLSLVGGAYIGYTFFKSGSDTVRRVTQAKANLSDAQSRAGLPEA